MSFYRIVLVVLTIYAWGLTAFLNRQNGEPASPLIYAATAAPAVIFILLAIPLFIRARFQRSTLCVLAMLGAVLVVSTARLDLQTAISVGSLCAMLAALELSRASLSTRFLNALFAVSIVTCAGLHALGFGDYGVIPGASDEGWRVSVFAFNATPSWLFGIVVLGANYFRGGRFRTFWMLLALYFVGLSASRTALIVLALCGFFILCTRYVRFRPRAFYKAFIPAAVMMLVLVLSAESILTLFVGINNPVVNAVLFRYHGGGEGADSTEQVSNSIVRAELWAAQLGIFAESPVVGVGTYDLQEKASLTTGSNGSETFLTGLFARVGCLALLFVLFMHYCAVECMYRRDRLGYCLMLLFAVSSLTYGSYIVPYDFVFLVLLGSIHGVRRPYRSR